MPRDDAGESREGGSWDFDLPDLGASTTPDHQRRRRARAAGKAAGETAEAPTGRERPPGSGRAAPPGDDDLLPGWATGRSASSRGRRQGRDEVDDRRAEPSGRGAAAGAPASRDEGWGDEAREDEAWDDEAPGDEAWDDEVPDDESWGEARRPWWRGLVIRRGGVIRALVILAVLLLVIVVAVLAFSGRAQDTAQEDPAVVDEPSDEDPFAGFTPRPSQEGADGASGPAARACGDGLSVRSSTDEETYAQDEDPVLILTLENTGEDPCTVNAGTARMDFTVSSGSETVFDSQHCQVEGQDRPIELEPGQSESARMLWDRNRSGPGCPADTEEVPPGGYEFRALLGEVSGDPAEFTLE